MEFPPEEWERMREIKERLERIKRELAEIEKMPISRGFRATDRRDCEEAWKALLSLNEEISRRWKGPSAAEEIRLQRERARF